MRIMPLANLPLRLLERLRVLPVLVIASAALFGFKVDAVRHGVADWRLAGAAEAVERQQPAPPAKPAGSETKTAEATPAQAPAAAQAQPAAKKPVRRVFSEQEIELLQGLSKRRDELDGRARELETREAVLQAAEKRIDEKIVELKKLEGRVASLVQQHDDEKEKQMRSLVKVYENMKPKDAARIFEELQTDVLLGVTERMKEQKVAPILAEMDPSKAKDLTVRLATGRAPIASPVPAPAAPAASGG